MMDFLSDRTVIMDSQICRQNESRLKRIRFTQTLNHTPLPHRNEFYEHMPIVFGITFYRCKFFDGQFVNRKN